MAIQAQFVRVQLAALVLFAAYCQFSSLSATAAAPTALCTPVVTKPIVVASPAQRLQAGQRAQPPLTDIFAWPDTPLGVIKTATGYEFFGSDGGYHAQQTWEGNLVGNNKAGSIVVTTGTLDKPLGSGDPQTRRRSIPEPAVALPALR